MQESSEKRHSINVVLVGNEESGKTQFFNLYCPSMIPPPPGYVSTIGAECRLKDVSRSMFRNSSMKLNVWDTSGQSRFKNIIQAYYHDANIIVYFIDASVELNKYNINSWLSDINSKAAVGASVVMVLSKSHLVRQDVIGAKQMQLDDIIRCWNEKNRLRIICPVHIISSETKFGIQELEKRLLTAAKKIPDDLGLSVSLNQTKKNFINTESFIKGHPILTSILIGFCAAVILSATGVFAPLGVSALGVIYFGILIGFASFILSLQVKNSKCFEVQSTQDTPIITSDERMKPLFGIRKPEGVRSCVSKKEHKQSPNIEKISTKTLLLRAGINVAESLSSHQRSDGSKDQYSFV